MTLNIDINGALERYLNKRIKAFEENGKSEIVNSKQIRLTLGYLGYTFNALLDAFFLDFVELKEKY